MDNEEDVQIKLARKYIKMKLLKDDITLRGFEKQRRHVFDLISRTVRVGESNSALVIGPRGCGKTTMINNALWELKKDANFTQNSILVKLNGLLHTDDKISLKSITTQMSLDNVVGDKVFGSFSENLSFLLSSLKSGKDKQCKSVIFILEEFDLFCHTHGSQTLLYNLFDIAQSKQAPVCVIGITCRLDVMELLEKRVKSRFSHRQIFLFSTDNSLEDQDLFEDRIKLFVELLSLPAEVKKPDDKNSSDSDSDEDFKYEYEIPYQVLLNCKSSWKDFKKLDPVFVSFWNENIQNLSTDNDVYNCLKKMYDVDNSQQYFKTFLMSLICKLSNIHPQIEAKDVTELFKNYFNLDDRTLLLTSLSILEISLVIAMKHQSEIFDNQPMNFEMVYNRYMKFASCNSSSHLVSRAVVLKAFEHLRSLELIIPIKETGLSSGSIQKEYQMYKLSISPQQISEAIKQYKALPTELNQWAFSSVI